MIASAGSNTSPIPTLEQTRQQLEDWRSTRACRSRVPEPLWTAAVGLAQEHGLYATARTLRLDYTRLKERVESAREKEGSTASPARERAPAFVELRAAGSAGAECEIEWERPGGKMRMQVKGITASDLVALSRAFWGGER